MLENARFHHIGFAVNDIEKVLSLIHIYTDSHEGYGCICFWYYDSAKEHKEADS